jgi:hypothetical protein
MYNKSYDINSGAKISKGGIELEDRVLKDLASEVGAALFGTREGMTYTVTWGYVITKGAWLHYHEHEIRRHMMEVLHTLNDNQYIYWPCKVLVKIEGNHIDLQADLEPNTINTGDVSTNLNYPSRDPIFLKGINYFFYDETWVERYAHGPFSTRKEAEEACKHYMESLG